MRQHPTGDRTVLVLAMLFTGILTLALRSVPVAQSPTALRPESFDEAGVRAAVSKRIEGRTAFSARLSAEPFADDAVWINAFGRRLVGRANIEKTGDRVIEFEISYLLEKAEDEWRILSYISSSDQNTEMAKAGLL